MSPELPDMTARGEVWAVGAVIMSLCCLFKDGPIKGPPAGKSHIAPKEYIMLPCARKGVRDTYLGKYSQELCEMVRKAMRYNAEHRPLSHALLDMVRTARVEADVECEPLPEWAFATD